MTNTTSALLLLFTTLIFSCGRASRFTEADRVELSDDLAIVPLTDNTWLHIAQLHLPDGEFPCNGLIYVNDGEAMILDSPLHDTLAAMLIDYVEEKLDARVVGLVIDHSHVDGAGGIGEFHRRGIPTYSSRLTCAESTERDEPCATNLFDDLLLIEVGNENVLCTYHGLSHAPDHIVTSIAEEKILFGGCMIKELGAGMGNIADADLAAWPATVRRVMGAYPDVEIVVPGHGEVGGRELLEYTIELIERSVVEGERR